MVVTASRSIATALAAVPGMRWLITRAGVVPVGIKSTAYRRIAGSIASRCKLGDSLVETNLGITNSLRVSIPATKHSLVFERPEHDLAERATLELTRLLAQRSAAFVDVGAHEGLFSFAVAADTAENRRAALHCFEADADLYGRLVGNLMRNQIAASAHNVAVSDHVGRQTFFRNTTADTSGSLTEHFAEAHDILPVEVDTISLSQYLAGQDIRNACLKVDVEGAGEAVWLGLRDEIERVDWLIMEIIGPETKAQLPRRIIAEGNLNAYYIRDFDLVHSKDGAFDYRAPFYNWLFVREGSEALAELLKDTRFQVH